MCLRVSSLQSKHQYPRQDLEVVLFGVGVSSTQEKSVLTHIINV